MAKNISIGSAMEKAFNKILPIPKQPKRYRYYTPNRALTWVPHGTIGNSDYEFRLEKYANELNIINRQRTSTIKYSSRGWCYLLEGLGKIHKGEFTAAQKAINDCRKLGLLPIDFVAQDQDQTRHFKGIHEACEPNSKLSQLKEDIASMLLGLPSDTTDYWSGEEYYVMMCVEKGDLINLFKPTCDKYHVPLVSSKGWPPIMLRSHIARLSQKYEAKGIKPVLLLFYDHDPAGLKISRTFKKNLRDCERGFEWSPDGLIIERFGLNAVDIEKHGLMWIENLRTGSGRTSRDWQYRETYGERKCEANALFKNDTTLEAGETICREAIEKYYGKDALKRFKEKEEASQEKLKDIFENPVWKSASESLDELIKQFDFTEKIEADIEPLETEKITLVYVDIRHYGKCPNCDFYFKHAGRNDHNRLVRCRGCNNLMRIQYKELED